MTAKHLLLVGMLSTVMAPGCDKDESNPIAQWHSIENSVNAAEPIDVVRVRYQDGTFWEFGAGQTNSMSDAYAKDGYLIVVAGSTFYFNLALAASVQISGHSVYVQY